MTRLRFSLCCVLVGAVACTKDATFTEPIPPQAAVHWMEAVPDTGAMDLRPIDIISNAGLFGQSFRGSNMFYQGIEAGTRHIRIFMTSQNPAITSVPVLDTTITFTAGNSYSVIHTGFARTGATPARRLLVVPDAPPPNLPAGKIAIRVVNAAPSLAGANPAPTDTTLPSDVYIRSLSNITTLGTPELPNVAYGQASTYAIVDTGVYGIGLRTAGSAGPVFALVGVPQGTAGTSISNPIAGSRVAGSVLTMIIAPRSVPGSTAPQSRPSSKNTESLTRSTDTVTVQSGSVTKLVNRSPTAADSTIGQTGTASSAGVNVGDVVFVSGAAQPEYNAWQLVMAVADTLICNPTAPADTPTKCAATNAQATTRFRYRFRIAGTPVSPATGTVTYRIYTPLTNDFTLPGGIYLVDQRPPNTIP